jgi:hypothetical protein
MSVLHSDKLNTMRFLSIEIGRECNLAKVHTQCPSGHPSRYLFGSKTQELTDDIIIDFWKWCRYEKDFRGMIMWHLYNEPTLEYERIIRLMNVIKTYDCGQAFKLITNTKPSIETYNIFDSVKFSDYSHKGFELDDRIFTATGEGKPYSQVPPQGWCGMCFGWEMVIDNYGNWNLCCSDWRCEESMGNIFTDDWQSMFKLYERRGRIAWIDEDSYNKLPRMCRACMDVNPTLHKKGGV